MLTLYYNFNLHLSFQVQVQVLFQQQQIEKQSYLQSSKNTQMEQILNLQTMTSDSEMRNILDVIFKAISHHSHSDINGQKILNALLNNLHNSRTVPESKFQTLMILKSLTENREVQFLRLLSNHPILTYLYNICKNVDPELVVQQKGRRLFAFDSELGNHYVRAILELFRYWGERERKGNQPYCIVYEKALNNLKKQNIKLPTEYYYINRKAKSYSTEESQTSIKNQKKQLTSETLQQTINFISSFLQRNNQISPGIQLFNSIKQFHTKLHKQQNQYSKIMASLINQPLKQPLNQPLKQPLNQQLNQPLNQKLNQPLNQQLNQHCCSVLQFLRVENLSYRNYFLKMNYAEYFRSLEEEFNKGLNKSHVFRNCENLPRFGVVNNERIENGANQSGASSNSCFSSNMHQSFCQSFIKHKEISKQNFNGFRELHQNLSKIRKPYSRIGSKSQYSNASSVISNLSDYSNNTAFYKQTQYFIPNKNLNPKFYDGRLVMGNLQTYKHLDSFNNSQDLRRFKLSNLRSKSILIENGDIQVGCKGAPYDSHFQQKIAITLYFGNKTNNPITNLDISFQNCQNLLIYSSPLRVPSRIESHSQAKLQLLFVVQDFPFQFLKINIRYCTNLKTCTINTLLPTSILALSSFHKLTLNQFHQLWNSKITLLKTQIFTISSQLPPKNILKYLPTFQPLTCFQEFYQLGSTKDYQIYSLVIILNLKAIVKMIIRPNYQCLIQLGLGNHNLEQEKYSRIFLETLQIILTEIDIS